MRLNIKKKFTARTDRVKSVDIHPTEPWVLASLYNGSVWVWNYETQATVKTFEVSELPVRAAKFISRKSWIITGGDEMLLKVYNYNTFEKVTQFEAHSDYVRSIAIHPSQSFVLSSGDDLLIKLWDWDKSWKNIMVFEGHSHYVMQIVFNPKDANTFASASLDTSIKVWSLNSSSPNYTLQGHEKGINCIAYYYGGDKPYLISGADDHLVKIWDYQNKTCVATLEGHTQNVSVVGFHPELPIIITGGEDGTLKMWHATTNRLEHSLNYGMERIWFIAYQKGNNTLAVGYDEGAVVLTLGREEPAISMDLTGKIIWAKHSEVLTASLKGTAENCVDGEKVLVSLKELGACEVYPQSLLHSPNGRFVAVTGDGEYIVYTALAWRNKSFGSALEFAWSPNNEFAVRESTSRIKIFDKQFKERLQQIQIPYAAEALFSGTLLGIRSSAGFVTFYDWESTKVVRRIEAAASAVFWNDQGNLVCIACEQSTYMLKFHQDAWLEYQEQGTEEGVEASFEFYVEIAESVKTGCWVGDCFVFINSINRFSYIVGTQVFNLTHFDNPMYLLGYLPSEQRLYYCDKEVNIYSWQLPVAVIQFQTAVLHQQFDLAKTFLPTISTSEKNKLAQFLEKQGHNEMAFELTNDLHHKFDLAVRSKKVEDVFHIAESLDTVAKWKIAAEVALNAWRFDLAETCFSKANDLESLYLLYVSAGYEKGLSQVAKQASEMGKQNLAFLSHISSGNPDACINFLFQSGRVPEAALMTRTYAPSRLSEATAKWKESVPARIAQMIEDIECPREWLEKEKECRIALNVEAMTKLIENTEKLDLEEMPGMSLEEKSSRSPLESSVTS
ncbi:Coatomer subunit beta' [Coelomomyces lativittatus]|nr:Coatomer subunit beta' [Coelomomyces lativittatus]KAJ1511952.1 Coatomer subunit beta' [Coelomomyces lativittatus]